MIIVLLYIVTFERKLVPLLSQQRNMCLGLLAFVLSSTMQHFPSYVQYIHGLAAKGVHYIHRPGPTLQDLGFFLLPVCLLDISAICAVLNSELTTHWIRIDVLLLWFSIVQELGQERSYISETVFTSVFLSFFLVSLSILIASSVF